MISKRKLKVSKPLHWGDYQLQNATALPVGWTIIWQTEGLDAGNQPYVWQPPYLGNVRATNPANVAALAAATGQAAGEYGLVGDRVWYTKSLDLRFNIWRTNTVVNSTACYIRIVVVTQRNLNSNIADFVTQYNTINQVILMKDWKIRYDKVLPLSTGRTDSLGGGAGGQVTTTFAFKPMTFRFNIPFKYRAEYNLTDPAQTITTAWKPPLQTYIRIFSNLADCVNLSNIVCRQWFRPQY